jgi:hypothetical protein
MGSVIFKSTPAAAAAPLDGDGSKSAKRIITEMKELDKNIQIWSKKIYEVSQQDNSNDKLEDKFRAERAEMVRRLGMLRHRPRIPEDEQPIVSMSPYHREKGKTSETMKLIKRGNEAGKCLCHKCNKFIPNTFDISLCKTCEHPISYHHFAGPPLKKSENTFPRRGPTRKELDNSAVYKSIPRTDPSYFPSTLIEQGKDAPPRESGIDDPDEYDPDKDPDNKGTFGESPETEREREQERKQERKQEQTLHIDIGKQAQDGDNETSSNTSSQDEEWVAKDKINGTDIEQELIDAGFSAEAGRGLLTYEDDSHYDGEWAVFEMGGKIERHGYGSMHFASGEVHSGDFERDLRHGKGKLIHPDGSVFRGEWKWGEIVGEGKGAMPSEDGSGKYIGDWFHGQRQGHGTMITVDGDSYTGEWYEDMMHGHGIFISNNGEKYTGTFVRGEMEGIGTMEWPSRGDKYEGHWSSGVMNGEGSFFSGVDGSLFRGMFVDGEKVGHGVIELASGDTYSGLFEGDDTDNVFGIIKTSAGDTFQVRPRAFRYSYEA